MGLKFDEIKLGDECSITKTFVRNDVLVFSKVSMDKNPIHIDEEAGKSSIFGACVVHGALVNSLFSAVLGMKYPGEGAIYLSQNSSFRKPVFIGDTVTAVVKVIELMPEKKFVKFETIAYNQKNEKVIIGDALVKPLS